MNKYNFDELIDRSGNSIKWDVAENELPMWVADMDFKTSPAIIEALNQRVKHGLYGYCDINDEWYDAYINWWDRRYDFKMEKEWLIFSTGIVPAISSIVRKITTPAEKVLIQTPVYNIFFNSILNNGRVPLQSQLVLKDNRYEIDFEQLEKDLSDPQTSLMILCNPQNPGGNIWDKDTLAKIGSLCKKYGVKVLSDEAHCDLTLPDYKYTPFFSVSDECREVGIACYSPSKTFNVAGIHSAAVAVVEPVLRHKVWRGLNTDEVAEPNVFAVPMAVAAYNEGEEWLEELRVYLAENRQIVTKFVEKELPELKVIKGEATYLLWIDCTALKNGGKNIAAFIRKETGLYLSKGIQYGEGGEGFLRMNLACPKARIYDGLERLKEGIKTYQAQENDI